MNKNIQKIIDIALNEVGYLEKSSNSQLDDKTANAGSGNYTKYARDMSKHHAGIYANGYAWCDTFVDWCFVEAFGVELGKELIGNWSAYTPTSAEFFKQRGMWYENNPQIGDKVYFYNNKLNEISNQNIVEICNKYFLNKNFTAILYLNDSAFSEDAKKLLNQGFKLIED